MEFNTILVEKKEGYAIIRFNRPKAMNAVNYELLIESRKVFESLKEDNEVRAVILTGNEKVFAAGADIPAVVNYTAFEAADFVGLAQQNLFAMEAFPKPIIAAINGYALGGGCEMALACDFRIAAENATIGLPEINLGIFPAAGGTQRLPRIIGLAKAKYLVMTGEFIDGKTAFDYGIVHKVVPAENVMEEAEKMAKRLTRKPPLALKVAKMALNSSLNLDIVNGCRLEQEGFGMLFSTQDQKEGMRAFMEGRKANFEGK